MKFTEDVLKEFDLEPTTEKEPVNVMQIREILEFFYTCAKRIEQKSQLFEQAEDENVEIDCIDIVTAKLNDFTQVFKDLIIFMRKQENTYNNSTSLRYCIISFDTFNFQQTEQEKAFLRELLIRNEITHDYFNHEIHRKKLIWIMKNCSSGPLDIYNNIYEYCIKKNLLNKYINRR